MMEETGFNAYDEERVRASADTETEGPLHRFATWLVKYYAVRVEVWHRDKTSRKETKLLEKIYRMEGW